MVPFEVVTVQVVITLVAVVITSVETLAAGHVALVEKIIVLGAIPGTQVNIIIVIAAVKVVEVVVIVTTVVALK